MGQAEQRREGISGYFIFLIPPIHSSLVKYPMVAAPIFQEITSMTTCQRKKGSQCHDLRTRTG